MIPVRMVAIRTEGGVIARRRTDAHSKPFILNGCDLAERGGFEPPVPV